jgi:hypothetical protein
MPSTSDPYLPRVDSRPKRPRWSFAEPQQPLTTQTGRHLPSPRPLGARIAARTLVIGLAVILGLRVIGSWIAEPLTSIAGTVPTWNVEVSSTSANSMLALAYSRESGIHVLRIPGSGADRDRRVIPAKIAAGDLHLVSLGLGQLDLRGRGPRGSQVKSYSATGRVATVFDRVDGTGVRTGW